MKDLFTVFETWLQGCINTCVDCLLDRVERLETERDCLDIAIREQSQTIENLYQELRTLALRVTELEDHRVENAPDEQLDSFKSRVLELFEDEDFNRNLGNRIDYQISDSDEVCTLDEVRDFIRNNVTIELDVSRY